MNQSHRVMVACIENISADTINNNWKLALTGVLDKLLIYFKQIQNCNGFIYETCVEERKYIQSLTDYGFKSCKGQKFKYYFL